MLPPKPSVGLHASVIVLRRHVGLLGRRLALDVVFGSIVALALSAAAQVLEHRSPMKLSARLAIATALALVASGLYVLFRTIVRAGALRALLARLRDGDDEGIFVCGAAVFIDALPASYMLAVLEAFAALCAIMALDVAAVIAQAHGLWGALVGALVAAAVVIACALCAVFASFVYALAVIDGSDFVSAWDRLMALLHRPGVPVRFLGLALILAGLGALAAGVDVTSTFASLFAEPGALPATFVLVPVLTAVYGVVADAVMLIFIAAASDRLPLGIAARLSLTVEGA